MTRKKCIIMILLLLLLQVQTEELPSAYAKMKVGTPVTLIEPGQILETITYNDITVEAAYTNGAYSGSDPVYSCAAFIKKFYSMVYDIGVYNLNSKDSIPLVYQNLGSFSQTDQPLMGDIVRDNTRTHWAIVKSVAGDIITVVQQNYRSGNTAWINCTIDRSDTGYSYFTYSNRVDNSSGEIGNITAVDNAGAVQGSGGAVPVSSPAPGIPSEIPVSSPALTVTSEIPEGTYRLLQTSNSLLLTSVEEADGWHAGIVSYQDSNSQMLSIVSVSKSEYALQFLSNRRFLAVSDKNEIISTERPEQNFVFTLRDNGFYTVSPASNPNKVIAAWQEASQKDQPCLMLRDYTGNISEFWSLGMVSTSVLTLEPKTIVDQKTLYPGYQDFTIGIAGLKKNASVTYASDQPSVAEVSEAGVVKAKRPGETTIHMQVLQDSVTYELKLDITVKKPTIKIASPGRTISVGQSIGLKAKKYGTKSTVTWQVSDQNIAEIGSNQTLIAKKRGRVTVTATTKDGLTAKIELTII